MTLVVKKKTRLPLEINLPTSKSYSNRLLILSSIVTNKCTIQDVTECGDVLDLINALKNLGVKIIQNKNVLEIEGGFPSLEKLTNKIYAGAGGTTARFLIALLSLDNKQYEIELHPQLSARPWQEFLNCLQSQGVTISKVDNTIKIEGPINLEKNIKIGMKETTQFASALYLASLGKVSIDEEPSYSSKKYFELTKYCVKAVNEKNFDFIIPKDWSSAAFPIVFGALTGDVFFPGLLVDEYQADSEIFKILEKRKSIEITHNDGVVVHKLKDFSPLNVDISQCLDLCFPLFFLAIHLNGVSKFSGAKNLIHKETNRLNEMKKLADQINIKMDISEDQNSYSISGNLKNLPNMSLDLSEDHRLVMCASLVLAYHNGGLISHEESIFKSWPKFFKDLML